MQHSRYSVMKSVMFLNLPTGCDPSCKCSQPRINQDSNEPLSTLCLLYTRTPRCSPELLPAELFYIFLLKRRIWHFSLLHFMRLLLAHSSNLCRSLWRVALPVLASPAILLRANVFAGYWQSCETGQVSGEIPDSPRHQPPGRTQPISSTKPSDPNRLFVYPAHCPPNCDFLNKYSKCQHTFRYSYLKTERSRNTELLNSVPGCIVRS